MEKKKIVIIGSGFGGLSAAALLAKEGFEVTVLEKNNDLGGRARVLKKEGFVFDMGPSWYLMPEVFEKYFSFFDKKTSDYYELKRLDPNYRVFFGNEKQIDIPKNINSIKQIFEQFEPGSAKKLDQYMKIAEYQYEIAMRDFMYKDYKSIWDFFNWQVITKGLKLHIFESIDKFARRYFKDIRLRQILEYTMVFLGGAPYNTPALYSIMSHVDFNLGVWYPVGGMGKIVEALEKLSLENGVHIITNENVKKISVLNGKAKSVTTEKNTYEADIILSNADYQHTETELLEKQYQTYNKKYWENRKMGPSAFLIYLGLNKKIKNLQHHNLYLDKSWDEHFDSLFKNKKWPEKYSYYVSCPSKTDKSVAEEGKENVFVLMPVASGLEDTQENREYYFKKTLKHLEQLIGEKITDSIIYQNTFAHNDFKDGYNAFLGTALGLSHTLFQTAVFRPKHHSKKVENLYYTGSYTHPGIGVPMVFISSQIVADEIAKKYGR